MFEESGDRDLVLKVEGLSYTYPGEDRPTLRDINLEVSEGEFILLIGPSGAGKTTFIQALNGIVPHIKGGELTGDVVVNGVSVAEHRVADMAEHIGLVFQDPETQLCQLEVTDEVAFGLENMRLPPDQIGPEVERTLARVGLAGLGQKYVYDLSGGQSQRLAIGSVLALKPDVIALDDPTANLDPSGAQEIVALLDDLRAEGRTVIVTSPWVDTYIHMATRLVVLHEGQVFADGTPREVLVSHVDELEGSLGVWVPQLTQIDRHLRERGDLPEGLPLTVDEAIDRYHGTFVMERETVRRPELAVHNAIEIEDVSHTYPDGTKALHTMSADIPAGKLTAIVGHNGSGKSTLAKLTVGLLPLKTGSIRVAGEDVRDIGIERLTRRLGYVFQNPEHQFVRDSTRSEIAYSYEAIGYEPPEVAAGVDEMLRALKLEDVADRHPFSLSGGQKRRLSVATMLAGQPEVLILDEPSYGQDYDNVGVMMRRMQEQLSQGVTLVMITHNMQLVETYADNVVMLAAGEKLFEGSPGQLWDLIGGQESSSLRMTPMQALARSWTQGESDSASHVATVEEFLSGLKLRPRLNGAEL